MNQPTSNAQTSGPSRSGPIPAGWVKLVTCGTADEADLYAAVLAAQDIQSEVFGANANTVDWFWQLFNDVDLIVPQADFERAKLALSQSPAPEVEPAEEPQGAALPVDEMGRLLVPAAAFDNAVDLRDAQTVLASAQIPAYVPHLVVRGDRPPGVGKRFILRVAEQNLEAAQALLAEEAEEDRDEPRCPKCGSWRVQSRKGFVDGMAGIIGLGGPGQLECQSCHFRGEPAEFLSHRDK